MALSHLRPKEKIIPFLTPIHVLTILSSMLSGALVVFTLVELDLVNIGEPFSRVKQTINTVYLDNLKRHMPNPQQDYKSGSWIGFLILSPKHKD